MGVGAGWQRGEGVDGLGGCGGGRAGAGLPPRITRKNKMIGQMMARTRRFGWLISAFLIVAPGVALADGAAALRTALDRAAAGDWAGAGAAAQGGGQVAADIIEWQRLRAGEGRLGEYEDFLARRAAWPGMRLLKEKGGEAVARSTHPGRVLALLGDRALRPVGGGVGGDR